MRLSTTSRSLSFGITIIVSTFSFNLSIPLNAFCILVFDSKRKGFVTTPTVRAPCSFAIRAITGAAPVPVPPPIPHVTNTMSAPLSAVGALQSCSACLSVFTAINSTPAICSSIIRFTALFPPPPTPTTIILAAASDSLVLISNKSTSSFVVLLISYTSLNIER